MSSSLPSFRTRRAIEGISAVLLPFGRDERPDLASFETLLTRTWASGITPAVNMDTGFVNLLTREQRGDVLRTTQRVGNGRRFVAGAFIEGEAGDPESLYRREVATIREAGGDPILFQCSTLGEVEEARVLEVYRAVARDGGPLLGFELGRMFAPFGRIYSLDFFERLLEIESFTGLKHSSLDRVQEWDRLRVRDARRPDFKLYTGNDLAIDMAFYGSDYLLGLSAFWPEAFAERDRLWRDGDPRAVTLNDLLQYLGFVAFRPAVPAYKHTAAQFLHLRGVLPTDLIHPKSPTRPASDVALLRDIADRIGALLEASR
jgi:dihydrodipicolinate synthase/N-acetylneuraminate lyase